MSKSVDNLRRDELEELKQSYFFDYEENSDSNKIFSSWLDITDEEIKGAYCDYSFVADDFFCNCGDNIFVDDIEKMYDFTRMTKADFLKSYSYLSEAEYDATKTVWDEWYKDEEISIEAVHAWRMAHYGYDCDND